MSYTRKDGQYLRWDHRAKKERAGSNFDKGQVWDFDSAIGHKLQDMHQDIAALKRPPLNLFANEASRTDSGAIDLRIGSCLNELLKLENGSVDAVFTSPPYCNRYDYTRTYALELVYLGLDSGGVKDLRQEMLSCTVENRSKLDMLEGSYSRRDRRSDFARIIRVFERQSALWEVLSILEKLGSEDRLNNSNIPRLVKNYFFEMCFVLHEVSRVLR